METTLTYISSFVTTSILSVVKKLNGFTQNITAKQWIIFYCIIAFICALYLAWFRIQKLRDQELYIKSAKNTKRANAIERFQNYSSQLASELSQKCDAELETPDNQTMIQPTRDKLFINPKFESSYMAQLSPGNQKDYDTGKQILENFLFVIDSKITDFVDRTKESYDAILNITIRNNQFVQEGKLDEQLDMLAKQIKDLDVSLDSELKSVLSDNGGQNTLTTPILRTLNAEENAYKSLNFAVEVKERLFEKVAVDKRKIFRTLCQLRNQIKSLQAQIDSLNPNLAQEAFIKANKEQDSVRLAMSDAEAKYKSYILILSRLATTSRAQDMLKQESAAMSTVLIQPANESQIDDMAMLKQKLATYADPGQVGNPVTDKAAEYDLAKKYSGAYQDYIDNMDTYTLNAKIDPIKIAGDLEEKTLNFLTKLNSNLRGENNNSENFSAFSPVNRFGTQKNNLGTWLVEPPGNASRDAGSAESQLLVQPKGMHVMDSRSSIGVYDKSTHHGNLRQGEPIPATDVSKLAAIVKSQLNVPKNKEGFQNMENTTKISGDLSIKNNNTIDSAYSYLSMVDGFIKYAYEYITGFMDAETADKLEELLTAEDNMIPLGVILVFISIVLFLASSNGSSDSAK